jgi:hypothetical protein
MEPVGGRISPESAALSSDFYHRFVFVSSNSTVPVQFLHSSRLLFAPQESYM